MNEHLPVPTRRDYLVPSDAPALMPRIILENLSFHRKSIRHATFQRHCRALAKINWSAQFNDDFRQAAARLFTVLEEQTNIFFLFDPQQLRVETFVRMVAYRQHWIHQPENWRPSTENSLADQVFSLIDHLFVTYPIPAYFRKAWMEAGTLHAPARDWFCQIASGKNIRTLPDLPTTLSSRAAHCAMHAPSNVTIAQAFRYGQVIAFGGSEALATEIIRSRIGENFSADRTWLTLIEKIAREPKFDAHEAPIVIDFIYYWIIEQNGRSPERLLKDNHIIKLAQRARLFWKTTSAHAAQLYNQPALAEFGFQDVRNRLLRALRAKWLPLETVRPMTLRTSKGKELRFAELCSELELQREGARMHHCVATYADWCIDGRCSIWTVTDSTHQHLATIRLYPKLLELDEVRAPFNQRPDHDVLSAVHTWAHLNQIDDQWLVRRYGFTNCRLLEHVG